jgi:hypothetical protein
MMRKSSLLFDKVAQKYENNRIMLLIKKGIEHRKVIGIGIALLSIGGISIYTTVKIRQSYQSFIEAKDMVRASVFR